MNFIRGKAARKVFFFEKKKQKAFILLARLKGQKFFGSFFQKRTPSFLGWARRRRRPERVINRRYPEWLGQQTPGAIASFEGDLPLISIIMPVHDAPVGFFIAALRSIRSQTYPVWELCLADDASSSAVLRAELATAAQDTRVKLVASTRPLGIAGATNAALGMAEGVFVALMDHDDLLAPEALACMAEAIAAHPLADMLFSDEDKLEAGRRASPYFKPGWNPDLMLGQNLVSHLGVYRRALIERLGGVREGFEGSQDYDLALRASREAREIRHVPRVLYHWRQTGGSFSATHAASCADASRRALRDHLSSDIRIVPDPVLPQWSRILYPVPDPAPLVSIILSAGGSPAGDDAYDAIEIVRGDVAGAQGEILLFLDPALVSKDPGWLRELVSHALRPEIGCVGARLDGPDGSVVHAGYVLEQGHAPQSLRPRSDADDPGYRGQFQLPRTVSAVSRACLAVRRDVFLGAGGFRDVDWPDVDLCLRLSAQGLRSVWTPHARLAYSGWATAPSPSLSRKAGFGGDPYANPNLVVRSGNYDLVNAGLGALPPAGPGQSPGLSCPESRTP